MQILTTISAMRAATTALRGVPRGATLGLVPTMGALHEGHLSLVRAARQSCNAVAATIFVNPLQFAPNEDFARYPRTFEADCELLAHEGVDLLFAPAAAEMYPSGATTLVDVPDVGSRLDGATRPGHFRGVATVVSKLFHIVQPDRAFFGQKDAAQVAVLRAMVRDLNFDLELVTCPTVRDADGLALSSRNRYLTAQERTDALAIPRALDEIRRLIGHGAHEPAALAARLRDRLQAAPGLRLDYAEIVHPDTLETIADMSGGALIAVAAWVGETRLIDNLVVPSMDRGVRP